MLKVSDMFTDRMVLRHSRPNPVWGLAAPGERVAVRLNDATFDCEADAQGRWLVWADTPRAGTKLTLTVTAGGETVSFADAVAGEVWLAGGQSNMELPLMCMTDGEKYARTADRDNVRIRRIPRRCNADRQAGWHFFPTESYDEEWVYADRKEAALTSAIGYVFAAKLSKALGTPVGIIDCNWGGTKVQPWLSMESLMAHDDTRRDVETFAEVRRGLGDRAHTLLEEYERSVRQAAINDPDFIEHNLADPLAFLKEDKLIQFVPLGGEGDPQEPGSLYEYMVKRVAPYGLNGVLWYQGESNGQAGEAERYEELFNRLLDCWRGAWMDPSLPFLTCQLATFEATRHGGHPVWPVIRALQERCAKTCHNVSMAVLLDVGEECNIHPLRKEPVGDRLYRLAMEDVYGIPARAHQAEIVAVETHSGGARLTFNKPIELRQGDLPELCDANGCSPTQATIEQGNVLCLRCEQGREILGVRYAQRNWLMPSLFDADGLPIAPFVWHGQA